VLLSGFRTARQVRVFPEGFSERVVRYGPRAIAGTLLQLRSLDRTRIPSVTHAVIVLQNWRDPLLSDEARTRLWNAFGVPVFEQQLNPQRRLIAAECAAHSGLHLVDTPRAGVIDPLPCPCGRTTPRLIAWGDAPLAAKAAGS
jgi:hypothetical protein